MIGIHAPVMRFAFLRITASTHTPLRLLRGPLMCITESVPQVVHSRRLWPCGFTTTCLSPQSGFDDIVLRSLGIDFLITRIEGKNWWEVSLWTLPESVSIANPNNPSMSLQLTPQAKLTTERTRTYRDDRLGSNLHCNRDQTKVMVTSSIATDLDRGTRSALTAVGIEELVRYSFGCG